MSAHRFENTLRACCVALQDVIAPAVDPANPLAQEQMKLVLRFLSFVDQRLPDVEGLAQAELAGACATARALSPFAHHAPPLVAEHLKRALHAAAQALAASAAGAAALDRAQAGVQAAVSALLRCSATFEPASREQVERVVLQGARHAIDLRRAWFSPLGLDPAPQSIVALERLLQGEGAREPASPETPRSSR